MSYDNDDDLDRMLFALPLEEPPADLRASILAATAYRPAPVFKPWEVSMMGAVAAVGIWLVVLIVLGGPALFARTLQHISDGAIRAGSNAELMGWLAAGCATAAWLTLFTRFQRLHKVTQQQSR